MSNKTSVTLKRAWVCWAERLNYVSQIIQPHLSKYLTDFWWCDEISLWSQHVVPHVVTLWRQKGNKTLAVFTLIQDLQTRFRVKGRDLPSQGWWAPPSCTRPQKLDLWLLFWRSGVAAWTVWAAPCQVRSCRGVWSELLAIALSNTDI